MKQISFYKYLNYGGSDFFTVVCLPDEQGKFPIVIYRNPYVSHEENVSEEELCTRKLDEFSRWLGAGYAVVFQHCRGRGRSTGAFVPYVHEREDGLFLRDWIRDQDFYNGELFLLGASYTSSLHYATAPFESDIKGAVLEVQDSERYRLWYRNGQMRKGHANWHFGLYKSKCGLNKKFNMRSFSELPLLGLSERVLGDRAEDFEQMLEAYSPDHEFWKTRFGGIDAKDAVTDTDIPVLLTTGYNDFYVGGVFRMWEQMSERTKAMSAVLVSPYNHGDGYHKELGLCFPDGRRSEGFGSDYRVAWFDHIRNGRELPFKKGAITYYRAFENRWESDFYGSPTKAVNIPLGKDAMSFRYDPKNPCAFREEGLIAESFEGRNDVITILTPKFEEDTFVKGRMKLRLAVQADCEDTAFYVRISLKREEYTYVLRHDITSLCYQLGDYTPNSTVELDFCFDEYAFLIKKGECLRLDISSTDDNTYVCHTNNKGEYYLQSDTRVAENKVYADRSYLVLPVE